VRRGVLRTRIALKVLHERWTADLQVVARFQREARAVAALRHKNIVAVHDLTQVEEHHAIEMELLRGESLGSRIKLAGRLSTEEALDVLLPIISAVQAVHDIGLVHRDLKPENILLARESDGSEVPKLLDFGVVHMVEDGVENITGACQQIGTPSYMSPEQFRGDEVIDSRADQWSLAVILYVMLTGRRPFLAPKNLLQTRLLIEYYPAAPLRDAGVIAPEALEAALFRALRKSRDERYPSVRDFGAALVPFARRDTRARFGALWGVADLAEPTTTRFPMPPLTLDADDPVTTRQPVMFRRELVEGHVAESESLTS
jgi:serine/threonine-protein kinase